jgi:hypothetical protein
MWETIPNPGRIRMYTSGCPKNQNKCWNKIGSPPPAGLKNDELILRSVSSIVMAPASTGRDKSSKNAVISTDQENKEIFIHLILFKRILKIVVIKLTAPKIEEAPAKCREKMDMSTEPPEWLILSDRGG